MKRKITKFLLGWFSQDIISALYAGIFNREADSEGLKQYATELSRTGDISNIIDDMLSSDEAQKRLEKRYPSNIVDALYLGLFMRYPDEEGKAYFMNILLTEGLEQTIRLLTQSEETWKQSLQIHADKWISLLHRGIYEKEANEDDKQAFRSALAANIPLDTFIADMLSSVEFKRLWMATNDAYFMTTDDHIDNRDSKLSRFWLLPENYEESTLKVETPEYIDWAYRIFLGREVESDASREKVFGNMKGTTLNQLAKLMMSSKEYQNANKVDVSYLAHELYTKEREIFGEQELAVRQYRNTLLSSPDVLIDSVVSYFLSRPNQPITYRIAYWLMDFLCDLRQFPSCIRQSCHDAVDIIYTRKKENIDIRGAAGSDKPGLLFVSGAWCTGSSAVHGYLKGSPECSDIINSHGPYGGEAEPVFLVNKYGAGDLLNDFEQHGQVSAMSLFQFFITYILNTWMPGNSAGARMLKCNSSLFWALSRNTEMLLAYIHAFKQYALAVKPGCSLLDFQWANYWFILDVHNILLPENSQIKHIILNNAINCHHTKALRAYPKEKNLFIGVVRDPRDQYLSLQSIGIVKKGVEQFVRIRNEWMKYCQNGLDSSGGGYDIYPMRFEDFVFKPSFRSELCKKLGISEGFAHPAFDPEFSMSRIGKYKKENTEEENKEILDKLAHTEFGLCYEESEF